MLSRKLMHAYFNLIYNPVYDQVTARFYSYHRLQKACLEKFHVAEGDKVLCVGIGTGNEIVPLLSNNHGVEITGVDWSVNALKKTGRKASTRQQAVNLANMDAQNLGLAPESFDRVVCLHLMDFVEDQHKVTAEILRVLKDGGEFVITYPSQREGWRLGINLFNESIRQNIRAGKYLRALVGIPKLLIMTIGGIIYVPLLFRRGPKIYPRTELEKMFTNLAARDFRIESFPMYQDFIIYGKK